MKTFTEEQAIGTPYAISLDGDSLHLGVWEDNNGYHLALCKFNQSTVGYDAVVLCQHYVESDPTLTVDTFIVSVVNPWILENYSGEAPVDREYAEAMATAVYNSVFNYTTKQFEPKS